MNRRVSRALLAGGRSTRMGSDKVLVEVNGAPMGALVADALGRDRGERVFMIGGPAETAASLGLGHIPDRVDGQGPVMGVLSALESLGDDVIVAACDLPCLDQLTVEMFASDHADRFDAVVAVTDGRRQPSLTRWNQRGLGTLQALVEAGERSMLTVLSQLDTGEIVCRADRLLNANRPDDLPGPPPS